MSRSSKGGSCFKAKKNFLLKVGGDEGIRTLDPQIANLMLSQLSYVPNAAYSNPIDPISQAKFLRPTPNDRSLRPSPEQKYFLKSLDAAAQKV